MGQVQENISKHHLTTEKRRHFAFLPFPRRTKKFAYLLNQKETNSVIIKSETLQAQCCMLADKAISNL